MKKRASFALKKKLTSRYLGSLIAVAVFACSKTAIVVSNPTRGMDVCVGVFCVCVVLSAGSGLATG
jgi:hypothetical protein